MLIPSGACRDIIDIKLKHSSCKYRFSLLSHCFWHHVTPPAGDKIITISAHIFLYKILELLARRF